MDWKSRISYVHTRQYYYYYYYYYYYLSASKKGREDIHLWKHSRIRSRGCLTLEYHTGVSVAVALSPVAVAVSLVTA